MLEQTAETPVTLDPSEFRELCKSCHGWDGCDYFEAFQFTKDGAWTIYSSPFLTGKSVYEWEEEVDDAEDVDDAFTRLTRDAMARAEGVERDVPGRGRYA